ncbi:hypothetical protein B0H11DRAFT_2342934 [Mycena galericulata]|nr:hypothetical protein B0H11DRAFT_2342934 [Mycena galericulata]
MAGGRPSSSYYFVDVQGGRLFYLDPHHSHGPRSPLRPFVPPPSTTRNGTSALAHDTRRSLSPVAHARGGSMSPKACYVRVGSMSPESFVHGGLMSPDFAYMTLPRTIFGIQDEPRHGPGVDDDDDTGLESVWIWRTWSAMAMC